MAGSRKLVAGSRKLGVVLRSAGSYPPPPGGGAWPACACALLRAWKAGGRVGLDYLGPSWEASALLKLPPAVLHL